MAKRNDDPQERMDIPEAPNENFYTFKKKVQRLEYSLMFTPIWKSALFWFGICFSIFCFALSLNKLLAGYNLLPALIPLFYSQTELRWYLFPKAFIGIYLALPLANILVLLTLVRSIHSENPRIANGLILITLISSLMSLTGILQILSLTTN